MVRLSSGARSLCLLLLFCAGCRAPLGPWAALPPPTPVLATADAVWQQLLQRRQTFQSLKGLARVHLDITAQRLTVEEMVVVLQGLDGMRLEGIGPFGQPSFLMIADRQRFALYTPQEARLISGTASAENVSRLFGIALAPMVLHYLLIGDIPLATFPDNGSFTYHRRHNLYVWEGKGAEGWQDYRVWFEPYHLQPVRFEVAQPFGDVVLQVQYEDFQTSGTMTLPYRVIIEQPLADRQVIWQYTDVQLNTEVSPALFRMRVPPGTQQVELE